MANCIFVVCYVFNIVYYMYVCCHTIIVQQTIHLPYVIINIKFWAYEIKKHESSVRNKCVICVLIQTLK